MCFRQFTIRISYSPNQELVFKTMLGCVFRGTRLVALIALFQVYTVQVKATDSDEEYKPYGDHTDFFLRHIQKETETKTEHTNKITRDFQLVNSCSNKLVQLIGHNDKGKNPIDALGKPGKRFRKFTKLRFESVTFGGIIKIQSPRSEGYLCFSRKGRLIIRHNGNKEQCYFKEIMVEQDNIVYTKLQSVANEKWFIGFRKNGKPLKGFDASTRRQNCFNFLKREVPNERTPSVAVNNEGPFNGPEYLSTYLQLHRAKQRTRRQIKVFSDT